MKSLIFKYTGNASDDVLDTLIGQPVGYGAPYGTGDTISNIATIESWTRNDQKQVELYIKINENAPKEWLEGHKNTCQSLLVKKEDEVTEISSVFVSRVFKLPKS